MNRATGRPGRWRIVLAATAALLLASLMVAPAAIPESMIVVHGPVSSAHLRLTVSGGAVLVAGNQGAGATGCEGDGRALECPTAGVGRIEIEMGPSDDKVEVLDALPIPLTVRLGAGSDKLIGNDEPDTCYSEESKRNRCYGYGGDDVCITGQQNSDCVGGDGNDYCKHGAGSDGCWGDAGDDICVMGPGEDGCHGGPGRDELLGGPDPDQLYGGPGDDSCDGGPGRGRSHECERGPGG